MEKIGGERQEEEEEEEEEETGFDDEDDWSEEWGDNQAKIYTVGDDNDTDLSRTGPTPRGDKLFGKRYFEYKATTNLFDLLGLEDECSDPNFVKWLMDKEDFRVERKMSESRIVTDYKFGYYGHVEDGVRRWREFETIGEAIAGDEHITSITEIREYYDRYRKEELDKVLKRAGIATAIGVSLISLITGLSLGLKRKGKDIVYDAQKKWKKLNPSKPVKESIPWTDLEKATGEGLITIGDNIYVIIAGVLIYLYTKKD